MRFAVHKSCILLLLLGCIGVAFGYNSDSYANGAAGGDYVDESGAISAGGWLDVGKLDWGPISPVPYWPLPFLPPAWPLFPNRDFAYGYYPFPYTWGFPGYSRGFYGSNGGGGRY
ncbi:hypothetical protein BV898_07619 [Hypsibius exemplaris]|uniref:Uncharacterized protein n=1 Tax=Hypsibius exemplaris TaxID=2072580 RepID=A0A1W0WT95_HYPEX|nr:hypothetical protein BV898_07619 [Hypsibius exemplaris]